MQKYSYVITLKTDGEPSSGFGGEYLNTQLPRDEKNRICIPASHLKGLMRENLGTILGGFRTDSEQIVSALFGAEGENGDGGRKSLVRISSAVVVADKPEVISITRTALENGHIKEGSLRTSESLGAGSRLEGEIECDFSDEALLKTVRLALISVTAIGGGRTRGAGECRIKVKGFEQETPGQLFREIVKADIVLPESHLEYRPDSQLPDESFVKLKITFYAKQPVCIPQRPMEKSNVITSGFAIPGSAVAGTLLTLMSSADPDITSACYRSPVFRCGPLLPVGDNECAYPVFISNSHKISKLPQTQGNVKRHLFGDTMIPDEYLTVEDYHWQKETRGLAMKGTEGVLLVGKDKKVSLLKSGDIPRVYAAHGVVNGARRNLNDFSSPGSGSGNDARTDNLFSQEAVCVSRFEGIVFMPKTAADKLLNLLGDGTDVAFGKNKSTMGGGKLKADRCDIVFQQLHNEEFRNRLFIVQTPVIFELEKDEFEKKEKEKEKEKPSSFDIMAKVLHDSGWGELEKESVMTSVIFGWNELDLEKQIQNTHRVSAKRMIVPGSVFLLKTPIPESEFEAKLAAGLGTARTPGFGAVVPHPMFASRQVDVDHNNPPDTFPTSGDKHPVYAGYELDEISGNKLSPSQIARLLRAAQASSQNGYKDAIDYLETQRRTRPKQIWECWEDVFDKLIVYFKRNNFDAVTMLKVWHDLRKARKED